MKLIVAAPPGENRFTLILGALSAFQIPLTAPVELLTDDTHPLAATWADAINVPVRRIVADYGKHGSGAARARNILLAQAGDTLLALWDGRSKNVRHMIDTAGRMGLRCMTHQIIPRSRVA